jgi:hypothetical protein
MGANSLEYAVDTPYNCSQMSGLCQSEEISMEAQLGKAAQTPVGMIYCTTESIKAESVSLVQSG